MSISNKQGTSVPPANSNTFNTSTNKNTLQKSIDKDPIIKEVYLDNFVEEIKILSTYLEKYNYIAMDTEFPGFIYQSSMNSKENYYRAIKTNVDKLKLIQVGITVRDENGNAPHNISATWQFNLKFNLNTDQFSNESIALLTNSGINFEVLETHGIPLELFGEYLITSGLIVNEELHWVSFHGVYDFAYFLKYSTNLPLPESEIQFFEALKLYFPNYYDIRYLVRYNDEFRGSLSKLGQELNVSRIGTKHQAGSDSLITSEIFFKLKKEYLSDESIRMDKNVLFGIGMGIEDNDPINSYNTFYNTNIQNYKINSINGNQAANSNTAGYNNYEGYNNFYNQNLINMQYNNYIRSNTGYFPSMNVYNTYNGYNPMNLGYQINNSGPNGLSNQNANMLNSGFQDENNKKKLMSAIKNLED